MNQLENCLARYLSNTWMGRTRTDGPDEFEPSKFDCIWIVSIKLSFKFEYRFCPTKDNQDVRQNDHLLSVSTVVVTHGHFYLSLFQFSYTDCFHQTFVQVGILVLSNKQ